MTLSTLIFIGISLAMDAGAVAISNALAYPDRENQNFINASCFGFAQAAMTLIGYWLGSSISSFVYAYDHWLAFLLLVFIGSKMLHEAKGSGSNQSQQKSEFSAKLLAVQAVATSIDALAVGIGLAALGTDCALAAFTIGLVTMAICLAAAKVAGIIGKQMQKAAGYGAGIILIILAVKILVEHLPFVF